MPARINSASDFLETVTEYVEGTSAGERPEKPLRVRYGYIDSAYVSGAPKVKFDGESGVSGRTYKVAGNYTPKANDRVRVFEGVIEYAITTAGYVPPAPVDEFPNDTDGWVDIAYASGFSAGTPGQLRYRIHRHVVYFMGGATGTFVSGTYHQVNATALPALIRPSAYRRGGAMGTAMRSCGWEIGPDGIIKLGANNTSMPSWVGFTDDYPLGS